MATIIINETADSYKGYTNGYTPFSSITSVGGDDSSTIYYMKILGLYSNSDASTTLPSFKYNSTFYIKFETNIANINSCSIKMETGVDFTIFHLPATTLTDSTGIVACHLTEQIKGFTNVVTFYAISTAQDGSEITLPINTAGDMEEFQYDHYAPPLLFDILEYRLDKCDENYEIIAEGPLTFVSRLKIKLSSGQIDEIDQVILYKRGNGTVKQFMDGSGGIIQTIKQILNGTLYMEEVNSNIHLFSGVDTLDRQTINGQYIYPIPGTADSEVQIYVRTKHESSYNEYATPFLSVYNAYDVLTLVGETELNNGQKIFGGVAIGMRPTVKEKGQPIFECAYPAYFNGHPLGFFANSSITFDDYTIFPGVMLDSNRGRFTIFLGEPIYSAEITNTGNLRIYGYAYSGSGFRTKIGYSNSISLISINRNAGILNFEFTSNINLLNGSVNISPYGNFTINFE